MGFVIDKQKSIIEILNGSKKEIQSNLDRLAKDYQIKTGRKVCKTCPSDIQYMILTLKNIYKMTQFKFKKANAHYKNKIGDKVTINNGNMTDEKALEFLKTNPERIRLFSHYPSNWKDLISGKEETEEQKANRLAAEAEAEAAKENNKNNDNDNGSEKPNKEDLLKMSLKELREKYPDIKATSINAFVEKVLA